MSWNLEEEEKLIRQWLTQLQQNEYKALIWKCINGQSFSVRNNNIESKEEGEGLLIQEPWRVDINLPMPTKDLPLVIQGSIELLKRLPSAVYRRIQNARQRYRVQYFDETGLFVAMSLVSADQRGIFTWRRFDQGEFIGAYTGLIWDKELFNVYYSDKPSVYMQKERYLFSYDETKFMDPTSVYGSLYSDFAWNPNLMPLVNEPPPWDAANARPMQPNDAREVAQKQIRFEACVVIEAYSEIYIRYDNPDDPYEQRTYPVGWTCQQVRSRNFMSSAVDFNQQRLDAEQNALVHQTSTKNTLAQLQEFQELRRSVKYRYYLKPRIVEHPDKRSYSSMTPTSLDQQQQQDAKRLKTDATHRPAGPVHYVWDMLKIVVGQDRSIRVFATVDLPINSRIPIFGIPLSESVYRYREQIRTQPNYPRPSYLFNLRSGFLDCDPVYQPYLNVGGNGLFMGALVRVLSTAEQGSAQANMKLVASGFLNATRRIRAGEELVREFPVPRTRRTKAQIASEQKLGNSTTNNGQEAEEEEYEDDDDNWTRTTNENSNDEQLLSSLIASSDNNNNTNNNINSSQYFAQLNDDVSMMPDSYNMQL